LLDDYYDNELSAAGRRHVEAHVARCGSCRAALEQLDRLSGLLSEYALPDTFTAPEAFQAQVALRVSRRAMECSGYRGAAWHLVPLALLCAVVVVQVLFTLLGTLGLVARTVSWLGIPPSLALNWLGITWPATGTILGFFISSVAVVIGILSMAGLYVGLIVLFVPYAGWVGALWRSTRFAQASGRCQE
jgi:predicted anti-sigma-YlaC factor YlaD